MDDPEWLTVAEFAELDSDAQHAVWKAHAEKRVAAVSLNGLRRYRRRDVEAVLAELEGA